MGSDRGRCWPLALQACTHIQTHTLYTRRYICKEGDLALWDSSKDYENIIKDHNRQRDRWSRWKRSLFIRYKSIEGFLEQFVLKVTVEYQASKQKFKAGSSLETGGVTSQPGKRALPVMAPATNSDDLSSITRIAMVKGEIRFPQVVFWPPYMGLWHACVHRHTK